MHREQQKAEGNVNFMQRQSLLAEAAWTCLRASVEASPAGFVREQSKKHWPSIAAAFFTFMGSAVVMTGQSENAAHLTGAAWHFYTSLGTSTTETGYETDGQPPCSPAGRVKVNVGPPRRIDLDMLTAEVEEQADPHTHCSTSEYAMYLKRLNPQQIVPTHPLGYVALSHPGLDHTIILWAPAQG